MKVGGVRITLSPSQSYAFQGGTPPLGGYILCTITAAATTQAFTNMQAGYGYQLDGVLVGKNQLASYFISINNKTTFNQTTIVINGGVGLAGGVYRILASTNLTNWIPVAANHFDSNGNFTFTNSLDRSIPGAFYRVVAP